MDDKIVIYVRQGSKGVDVRYVDADSGEVLYDMAFTHIAKDKLSDVIRGIEEMHAGRIGNVSISWDVKHDE
ncbi:hypothetical protein ACFQZE_11675 [Paenibacillus sp. GCM10027627]|uniref:hypothetical protein n=1 Tax=unclassified Paenibacillus TaxID=185978 RepID=UPI00362B0999